MAEQTEQQDQAEGSSGPEIRGIAGYETPFPYVERLQEKMDELTDRRVPIAGRFCGFCYGRLRDETLACPFCGTAVADREAVQTIPSEVLGLYRRKKRTESIWVYSGAMVGLLIAAGLFVVLVLWGSGILGHPGMGFLVLIGGGYVLAQVCGPLVAAQIAYRRGARRRDRTWEAFLVGRDGAVITPPLGAPET